MRNPVLSAFLAALLVFSGCASRGKIKEPPAAGSAASSEKTASEEVEVGQQLRQQILSSFYPYTEPNVVNYVNRIGLALAAQAERQDLPYTFTILYNDKIYATSSPGGFVYITTGMIFFIENEAELAAVLAHEIGELQYKDPKLSKGRKVVHAMSQGGAMVAPIFGPFGALAALGFVAVNAASEGKVKAPEDRMLAADRRALYYMERAGYDPQGLIDLIYKFLNAKQEVMPYFYDYYQSRPITQERFHEINKVFTTLPLQGKTFSTNHQAFQETTQGIREMYKT